MRTIIIIFLLVQWWCVWELGVEAFDGLLEWLDSD